MTYIKPPPFFAHRVIRALTKTCASHQVGLDGVGLISVIAHQWDAIRYARPVGYHLATLMNLLGMTSKHTFYRLERRCVAAGWLQRTHLGTRLPILYTVCIPEHARESTDGATEDGDGTNTDTNSGTNNGTNTDTNNGTQTGPKTALKRDSKRHSSGTENGTPSTLLPLPIPSPLPERENAPARDDIEDYVGQAPSTPRDADRWHLEQLEPWAKGLRTLGCKVGPNNWRNWKRIIAEHGHDRVLSVAGSIPAVDRWDDKVEEALGKSDVDPESRAALDRKWAQRTIVDNTEEVTRG